MKRFSGGLVLLFYFIFIGLKGQSISLEEIWGGKFIHEYIDNIKPMKNGRYYTILNNFGIQKHSYENLDKIETVLKGSYSDYSFDLSEKYILLEKSYTPIYRRSKKGFYDIYDIEKKKFSKIFNNKKIMEPIFSPSGEKISFSYNNNLYYQNSENSKITSITKDGKKGNIINGTCDWVYEEEFGFVRHYEWSNDEKFIAYVKFDESKVKEVSIPIYNKTSYPEEFTFKYPKAGEETSKVSLHLHDLETEKTYDINLGSAQDYYILKIIFSKDNDLFVISSNRFQNKIDVSKVDLRNKKISKLFSETSKTWLDTDNLYIEFVDDNHFIWASDKDGFRHIYLYNNSGKQQKQITSGKWEVCNIYGIDKEENVYFQSTEKGANNRIIASVDIASKKKIIIAPELGTHEVTFSSNYNYFIDEFSTANTPPVYNLRNKKGNFVLNIESNKSLLAYSSNKDIRQLEFIEIPNDKGTILNAWIIKPKHFDINKKHPVLMYVYGGPGHQTVINSWDPFNYWWFQMLAQYGYIVVSVDGRGTGGKGADFKKSVYKQLGTLELEDQIAAAKWLGKQSYVDSERIGIWGWSYGGYLSSLCMLKAQNIFKTGIAVAPVTNWRFYDNIYTERFMQTPQANSKGYDNNSPINFAGNLHGNYLIIHGAADDNVHLQHSMEMIYNLQQEDKQFEMEIYPNKNHGIYGGKTRYQLYKRMTLYLMKNL